MLPILRVEKDFVDATRAIAVHVFRANDGYPGARFIGHPERVPDNWLRVEEDRETDVPLVLEKADRYCRFEGQAAVLVYDADNLWQDDWGKLQPLRS